MKIPELRSLIERHRGMLESMFAALETAIADDVPKLGRTGNAALIVAGLLENYYTCLETVFLRISQHFENHLREDKWHADLLEKMTLRIEGIRIPVVSEENYTNLLQILRFRHFKRYYFEIEYDWDRLDFLVLKLRKAHPIVLKDLERFLAFLAVVETG